MLNYRRITVSAICICASVLLFIMWLNDIRETKSISAVPYAFLILVTIMLAAIPWAKNDLRYSLRGLLIVMTLVALLFGLLAHLR